MTPFSSRHPATVAALGETALLVRLRRWLGDTSPPAPFGLGDDCAVLPPARGPQLVTTDPVIYGRHFDDRLSPRAAGAKLLKRNLSDIAAMGGRPQWAVVALALAPDTRVDWVRGFYLGLAATARRRGSASLSNRAALCNTTEREISLRMNRSTVLCWMA